MPFQLLPVLDTMINLYQEPIGFERFHKYITIINGNSRSDMELPVGGYNPMAKSHVLHRLKELKEMGAEEIVANVCREINALSEVKDTFKVSITLADDLMGGWTEHYSTDYSSRFKLNAMVKRRFCCVYLFTGEDIARDKIISRTKAYIYRTIYWLSKPRPVTLAEHIAQETEVAKFIRTEELLSSESFEQFSMLYDLHKSSTDYPVIFNFLYGDKAAEALGYTPLGVTEEYAGYRFAAMLS